MQEVKYTVIDSNAVLNDYCRQWSTSQALAMDTEFIRTSTFYPRIGLVQIFDGNEICLIDPLPIDDWTAFKALMVDPEITKVFHSCSEDMLVFIAFLGVMPTPLYDTQIGAAIANNLFGLSYQNLVINSHDIELPKGETRSDWLQRPLTSEQLSYAALDVAYLLEVYEEQVQSLSASGRLTWVEEECARQLQQYDAERTEDFSAQYENFKSAWQLKPIQLIALQQLAAWREERARKRDKPRNWIIRDKPLFQIAASLPSSKGELAGIEEISDNFIRYEGELVLGIIQAAKQTPESAAPTGLNRPLTSGQKQMLKKAQVLVENKAKALEIPVEILARKKLLMALLYAVVGKKAEDEPSLPGELQGWRGPLIKDDLIALFNPGLMSE